MVTPDRWDDLERLFGANGAYSGCWCMYFRQSAKEFAAGAGAPNRDALQEIVCQGREPGLLAYDGSDPVGWVALSPREELGRVLRSPVVKPLDESTDVWAVPCFYVARTHRRQGVSSALLDAAVETAADRGAHSVEGYPMLMTAEVRAAEAYTGSVALFERAGFTLVEPIRSPRRRVMRKALR